MINLTKDIIITKAGDDLTAAIKSAISQAKKCICEELFKVRHISPNKVSSSSRNEYYNASIIRLFDDHLNPSNAPEYDEAWIHNAYLLTKTTINVDVAKRVISKSAHTWLNRNSLGRLSKDCILILHFLWQEQAVLLPVDTRKPTVGNGIENSNWFEVAASTYTEVMALVRKPFLPSGTHEEIQDITTVIKPTAIRNFEMNAWRMVRSTDWHKIENINPNDISKLTDHLLLTRQGKTDWFMYPFAPAAFWNYVQRLYPDRCQKEDAERPIKNVLQASAKALISGEFAYPEEYEDVVAAWVNYQDKYIKLLKARGMKKYFAYSRSFAIFNTFLFSDLPTNTKETPPFPKEFNRRHIEGDDFKGLLTFLSQGRPKGSVKVILYHLDAFFSHLSTTSNIDEQLTGFINPISDIDFPIVARRSTSDKPAFHSEHFPYLLQYCYAVEAFATHLADKVFEEGANLYDQRYRADLNTKNWSGGNKVVQTEKYGYVPIVFYRNPLFDISQPKSDLNRPMSYEPLCLLPRFLFPLVEGKGKWLHYPQLNYIRHNLIALETGIRSIHIRWLDKRTYGKNIDHSKRLPPICKLHVNTDKANDAWDATVSKSVIELLDRQKLTIAKIGDPAMEEATWYDGHEESVFGKIVPIFPCGLKPGVLDTASYAKYFKKLIYSFDLFCRFQLDINTTNPMPDSLDDIDSIENPQDYLSAINLEPKASKLIEHTPHSCRVSVVSEYIKLLPPSIIGAFITGHATDEHVIYYAKLDPEFLKSVADYQKSVTAHGWLTDNTGLSSIKAEDIASKLQQALRRDKDKALFDFGAISFEREGKDEVLSGIKSAKQRPIDSLAFMPTHICPFGNRCPNDIVRDLGAVPGTYMPCGGCYYSIKTVDHLPRIHGHIRALTDECSELESYIAEAKKNGATPESLVHKANHRKALASEIISWSVTAHCLEQMYSEVKTRSSFLVEQPEIVTERLERLELQENSLSNLIARTSEAKSHSEYFTPQLKQQVIVARNKLLAFTGDFNRMLQETPTGFTLIDEFRGLIRSACEVLGISLHDLGLAMSNPMDLERPNAILKLISKSEGGPA